MSSDTSIRVITGLQYSKSLMDIINNMTYIVDYEWKSDEYKEYTLPACFFYVRNITENRTSNTSKKPIIMYTEKSALSENSSNISSATTQIIADNINNEPKSYSLDIIVPMQINRMYQRLFNLSQVAQVSDVLFRGSTIANGTVGLDLQNTTWYKILKSILSPMIYSSNFDFDSYISTFNTIQDGNKISLDAMWEKRRILEMKLWQGWRFVRGVIESYSISKYIESNDCYNANLTIIEQPIITTKSSGIQNPLYNRKIPSAEGDIVLTGLKAMRGI